MDSESSLPTTTFDPGEITFEEDCLIGAEDKLERWACHNPSFLTGYAYDGTLTETIIGLLIITITLGIIIVKKTIRKSKKTN